MFKTTWKWENSFSPFMMWVILGCVNKFDCTKENGHVHFISVVSEERWKNRAVKSLCFDLFAQGMLMGTSIINSLLLTRKGYKIDNFPRKREMEYSYKVKWN